MSFNEVVKSPFIEVNKNAKQYIDLLMILIIKNNYTPELDTYFYVTMILQM